MLDQIDLRTKDVTWDKKDYYLIMKRSIQYNSEAIQTYIYHAGNNQISINSEEVNTLWYGLLLSNKCK